MKSFLSIGMLTLLFLSVFPQDTLAYESFPSWLNAKTEFGAVGDGVTDDTAAIQQGLEAIGTYHSSTSPQIQAKARAGVLYLPAGTYRITGTLNLWGRQGAVIQGQGDDTILQWDGPDDQTMIFAEGIRFSFFRNLTLDGANRAGIGIDQSWWQEPGTFSGTANLYEDLIVRNFRNICLRAGDGVEHLQDDSSAVKRSRFINCGESGIQIESANAMSWWIEDSTFINNKYGVKNLGPQTVRQGPGPLFWVRRSMFENNSESDVWSSVGGTAIHNSFSRGSKRLLFAGNGSGQITRPITLQGNKVEGITASDKRVVSMGDVGPYTIVDNVFNTGDTNQPAVYVKATEPFDKDSDGVIEEDDWIASGDVLSMGNTFTSTQPIETVKKTEIDNQIVSANTIPALSFPDVPAPPDYSGWQIVELSDYGLNGTGLQAAINAAVTVGSPSIVHIPYGRHSITTPITIPPNKEIALIGDGQATILQWSGSGKGPMFHLEGPSHAVIKDLNFSADNAVALEQTGCNQPEAFIGMDRIYAANAASYGILLQGCDYTETQLSHIWLWNTKDGLGVNAQTPQTMPGQLGVYGAQIGPQLDTDFVIRNGARVALSDIYMEHTPRFIDIYGNGKTAGTVVVQGALAKIDNQTQTDGIRIHEFPGKFTFLQSDYHHAGTDSNADLNPTTKAVVKQTGAARTDIASLGVAYLRDNHIIAENAQVTEINSRGFLIPYDGRTVQRPNVWSGETAVITDALSFWRNSQPRAIYPPKTSLVTSTRYENLLLEHCDTCMRIVGAPFNPQAEELHVGDWTGYAPVENHPMDVDGNGIRDLVRIFKSATGQSMVDILFSNGTDFYRPGPANPFDIGGWESAGERVRETPMDFNGDGKEDLLRIFKSDTNQAMVDVLYSNGTSLYRPVDPPPPPLHIGDWSLNGEWVKRIPMYVNNDTKQDLVSIYKDGNGKAMVDILFSNGTDFYRPGPANPIDVGGWAEGGADVQNIVLDVNGDEQEDLVRIWKRPDGKAMTDILYSNGTGFYRPDNPIVLDIGDWTSGNETVPIFAMDIDGNGKGDLVRVLREPYGWIADILYSHGTSFYRPDHAIPTYLGPTENKVLVNASKPLSDKVYLFQFRNADNQTYAQIITPW